MYFKSSFKRVLAKLLTIVIFLTIILSLCFIVQELRHEHHTEEKCPICYMVQNCINVIKQIRNGFISIFSVIILSILFYSKICINVSNNIYDTLVSLSVRLND